MGLCLCSDIIDSESEMAYMHKLNSNMAVVRNKIKAKKLPVIWMDGSETTGKQNHGYNIAERFGYAHIQVDNLMLEESRKQTDTGRLIKSKLSSKKPVQNKVVINLIKDAFIKAGECNGYLVNGFPKTPKQASLFVRDITSVDCIILLEDGTNEPKEESGGDGNSHSDISKDDVSNKYEGIVEKINTNEPPADVFLKIEAAILDRLSTHPS